MDACDLLFQLMLITATRFDDITDKMNVMQHLTFYGLVHFWLVMQCVVKNKVHLLKMLERKHLWGGEIV